MVHIEKHIELVVAQERVGGKSKKDASTAQHTGAHFLGTMTIVIELDVVARVVCRLAVVEAQKMNALGDMAGLVVVRMVIALVETRQR